MKCTEKEQLTCNVEKMGCEGCAYNDKTADEIKVGEYVRDNEGNIDKIINTLSLFKDVYLYLGEEGYQYSENAISKHSKNIIDLIEVRRFYNIMQRRLSRISNKYWLR